MNRIVIAGAGSGGGKTTVTSAVLRALGDRGLHPAACKCGPDYIDPMFLRRAAQGPCGNLDRFFFSENTLRFLLAKNGAGRDLTVIEGVMGYYDGAGITTTEASTYEVAKAVDCPVVLIVNARGASLSILALLEGFVSFRSDSRIRGVILNQCTAGVYEALAGLIRDRFGGQVRPLGFLPPLPGATLESRHLGLVTAAEVADLEEKMDTLGRQAAKTIDLDGLLELAADAPPLAYEPVTLPLGSAPLRLAIARDKAFCFYYEDSLDALVAMGCQWVPFSPLEDVGLPENVQGLYLGGGYPELYAQALSENRAMRASILSALRGGMPCVAECGGFMYLTEAIGDWPMVGYLSGSCADRGKLTRFGYITLRAQKDQLLCKAGEAIPAHEFHHWDASDPGGDFRAEKRTGRQWDCVHTGPRLYAGFPHLHFYANPRFAVNFYRACEQYQTEHAE